MLAQAVWFAQWYVILAVRLVTMLLASALTCCTSPAFGARGC
jgi:hypothetical protein